MNNYKLKKAIQPHLDLVDKLLATWNMPINERPFHSAVRIVEDFVEISGGTKEKFIESEWFPIFVIAAKEWYIDRYGPKSCDSVQEKLSGLVLFHSHPIKVEIPVTTSRVEVPGETAWISFPDVLEESEEIIDLFPSKPNFSTLPPSELDLLNNCIKEVVHWSRSTRINMMSASDLCVESQQMASGAWGHIEKAVSDILTLKPECAAIACWELHLAIEKAFKIYIRQKSNKKAFGHDLNALNKEASMCGLSIDSGLLSSLPSEKKAIKYRYGELKVSVLYAYDVYRLALQVVYNIAKALSKKVTINNARILVKKPEWV